MARPNPLTRAWNRVRNRARDALADALGLHTRGFDAASWRRFPAKAHMGRAALETIQAAPQVRARARYFVANSGLAAAGVSALVTYSWGAGAVPAHALAQAFLDQFWNACDADGRLNFGGLIALAIRAMIVDGECFIVFRQREDGLKLQLLPAEQVDESLTRELGGGAYIAAGIEFTAQGERLAYWIRPFAPTQQFETWAPPVRIDASDVLHLMRPEGIGQVRGISWLVSIMLKLADLGLLSDALLKGFQIAAMHAGFLEDATGASSLPFDGDKDGTALDVSLEPGVVRRLPPGYKISFSNPQAAQNSIEFMTACAEEIAAGLGAPAFMLTGNVNRANYSSLRAALITFKASLEALQFNILVPQLLTPIWRRWVLTQQLSGAGMGETTDAEWRFPAMPEADPMKQVQATGEAMKLRIMSRKEAVEARGEDVARVDSDIAADAFAGAPKTETTEEPDAAKPTDTDT